MGKLKRQNGIMTVGVKLRKFAKFAEVPMQEFKKTVRFDIKNVAITGEELKNLKCTQLHGITTGCPTNKWTTSVTHPYLEDNRLISNTRILPLP